MKTYARIIAMFCALLMITACFAGCANTTDPETSTDPQAAVTTQASQGGDSNVVTEDPDAGKYDKDGYLIDDLPDEIDYKQDPSVYEKVRQAYLFEVEKNRFKCNTELEACYLCGSFAVRYDGDWTPVDHNAALADRKFVIVKPQTEVELMNLERQGYLFFAGTLTLTKTINAEKGDKLKIKFKKYGTNVIDIKVNNRTVKKILWAPYEAELGEFLNDGENIIEISLTNNLRNLLGPLHSGEELLWFRPGAFQKEPSFWNREPVWYDNYCFVEFGLTN